MLHHCTCPTDDVINDQICIIGKLEYLWNKKRYHKKKNTILLYFEEAFKWAYRYLLNDLFFWSCALSRFQCPASISLQFHHVKCNVGQLNAFKHFGSLQLPPGASVICLFHKDPSHAFQTRYCSGFMPVVLCRLFCEVQRVITRILSYSNNYAHSMCMVNQSNYFSRINFFINDYDKTALQIFLVNCETVKVFGVVVWVSLPQNTCFQFIPRPPNCAWSSPFVSL